jgi:hypothetical protein
MEFLRDKTIFLNLIIMILMWVTVGFSFYMVKFQLKYLPGNIYTNSVSSSGAEIGGIIGAGVLY